MSETLIKISKNISFCLLCCALIITPIFFLPLTTDFFGLNKQMLFLLLTSLSLISWLIYSIASRAIRLTLSPMLLPFFLFVVVCLASVFSHPPVNMDVWLSRPSSYLALLIFFILFSSLVQSSRQVRKLINWLIGVASLLGLLGILSISGAFLNFKLPSYLIAKDFTPIGSLMALVCFLIAILPLSLVLAFKVKIGIQKLIYFLAAGVITSSIILVGSQLIPGRPFALNLLPKLAGWSIAIDTFKSILSLFLGAGPTSFLQQFNRFKPISLNQMPLWNISYTISSNEYLQLMTTLGLGGIITFIFIILNWFKLIKRKPGTRNTATQTALNLATITCLALGLFFPFSLILWLTLVGFLAMSVGLNKLKNFTQVKDLVITLGALSLVEPDQVTSETPAASTNLPNILPTLIAVPLFIGLGFAWFNLGKAYAAEYYFRKSLEAASRNEAVTTYNLQIKTLEIMPKLDRYHVAYANTNWALANSLASQTELSDQDQQTMIQLIQQAVREARSAAQLGPNKANNWENLAALYRNLVNFASGADQFAISAYVQTIRLAPANPILRLELGGLFYNLKDYENAIDRFKEALTLKSDYANAYYNLAIAYRDSGKYLEAYQAMQQVASLVPADSPDAQTAQKELADLKAKLPQAPEEPTAPPQQLSEPQPPPAAPAELEQKVPVEPPAVPASPSPSPSPSE